MVRNDAFVLGAVGLASGKPEREKLSKSLRDQVWFKYMRNKAEGKCYCCRLRPIHVKDFEVWAAKHS